MGLVGISPPATLSPRVVRFTRERVRSDGEVKADAHLPGSMEAALPLTPQRLELIKACAENALRSGESLTASRIAQRFAPRAPRAQPPHRPRSAAQAPPVASFATLAAGMRWLAALLILATLLPNLTLAAFWLGLVDVPWSTPAATPVSESPMSAVEPALPPPAPLPVLSAPDALEAPAGGVVLFPIALDGTDRIAPGSSIIVKGLPPGAVLSTGHASGAQEWSLRPGDIGDLQLAVPETASGAALLTIQLAAPGNRIVADASTLLKVLDIPATLEPRLASVGETESLEPPPQALDIIEEEATAAIEPPPIDPNAPPLPTRRPEPSASGDAAASFVRPSAYVNLRQTPSSSSAVVAVVAKGTKLRVMGRKRGWVQVSNPTTSQTGWIYSGNVLAAQ